MPRGKKIVDRTNKRYGKLTALYMVRQKSRVCWFCKCDCGGEAIVHASSLQQGITKSCGCIKRDICIARNKAGFKGYKELQGNFVGIIRRNAKIRGLKFELEPQYLYELLEKQGHRCALSGVELCFGNKRKNIEQTASLDRIDSDKGYIVGNVQWVHKVINFMKGKQEQESFINLCKLISKYNS